MHRDGSEGIAVDRVLKTFSQRRTLPVSSQSEGGTCRQALRRRRVECDDSCCCIALLLSSCTVLRMVSALQSLEQTRIIACEETRGEAHGEVHMSVRPSVLCLTLIKWIKIYPERVGQKAKGAAESGIPLVMVPPERIVFSFIFRDGSSCQKATQRRLLIRDHFQLPPWRSFAASPCSQRLQQTPHVPGAPFSTHARRVDAPCCSHTSTGVPQIDGPHGVGTLLSPQKGRIQGTTSTIHLHLEVEDSFAG